MLVVKCFNIIEKKFGNVFEKFNLSSHVNVEILPLIRIISGIFYILTLNSFSWLGDFQNSIFFTPPSISFANLFYTFFNKEIYIACSLLLNILFIFIILGIHTRYSAIIAYFILTICNNFIYSFGKIDHYIISELFLIVIAMTNFGSKFALKKDKPISEILQQKIFTTFALVLVIGFFSAGIMKLKIWADFDTNTSGILSWYFPLTYDSLPNKNFLSLLLKIPNLVLESGDYFVSIIEVTGIFFLYASRNLFRIWLVSLSIFHLLTTIFLGIPFINHAFIYAIFLCTGSLNLNISLKKTLLTVVILTIILKLFLISGELIVVFNILKPIVQASIWLLLIFLGIQNLLNRQNLPKK